MNQISAHASSPNKKIALAKTSAFYLIKKGFVDRLIGKAISQNQFCGFGCPVLYTAFTV
jgi:hypothetical protein